VADNLSPGIGRAVVDTFQLHAPGWSDDPLDEPLEYSFFVDTTGITKASSSWTSSDVPQVINSEGIVPLRGQSPSSQVLVALPQASLGSRNRRVRMTIGAVVRDSHGSAAMVTVSIYIDPALSPS